MSFHDALTGQDIHVPHRWTYANAAARTGATGFVTADIGKWAFQSDTSSFWVLTATSPTWIALGTLTSLGLTLPAELTVSGSPVTGSGTISAAWANQTTNKVFAAPNGSTGAPSFRALVAADIPAIPESGVTNLVSDLASTEKTANKGAASGYASLDGGGKVPTSQLPVAVLGAVDYQGVWDANANSPALASGTGTKGFYYKVSTAGNTTLDGNTGWHVGDWAVYDGTVWEKIDNYEAVTSVAGKIGAVTLVEGDIANLTTDLAAKMINPMTTSGDMIYGATGGAATRIAKGSDGQYLVLSGGLPTWGAASSAVAKVASLPASNAGNEANLYLLQSSPATLNYLNTVLGTTGLTNYYPLNETSGTTATDNKGSLNGALSGTITLNQTSIYSDGSPSFLFGGGQIQGSTYWPGGQTMTIICEIVTPSSFSSKQSIWGNGNSGGSGFPGNGLAIFSSGALDLYQDAFGDNATGITLSTSTAYHIVVVYTSSNMTVYVNGGTANGGSQAVIAHAPTNISSGKWYVGAGVINTAGTFTGRISHVAVFNFSFAASDVTTLWNARNNTGSSGSNDVLYISEQNAAAVYAMRQIYDSLNPPPKGFRLVLCAAYTPGATGADLAEYVTPFSPDDGTTSLVWNVRRISLRVQTPGGSPSVTLEKSSGSGNFSATAIGTVTLSSGANEGSVTTSLGTVTSGDKIRFSVGTLGTASNWTVEVLLGA